MLPRNSMPTIKNPVGKTLALFLGAAMLLSACSPPGPRALVQGKKLLDEGKYSSAIEKLKTATELLPTNALAFNCLGLAYHQAGQPGEAEKYYLKAIHLDRDLMEAHFNLGCLYLTQTNRIEQAKTELITFTLRRDVTEGWLKLGLAQLRSRDPDAAGRSFTNAIRLSPQNPEALTGLGLARLQRNQPRDAAQFFSRALKEQPDYAPALLNLAIVAQERLNDRALALQKYREYLALKPAPENSEGVRALVRQLEQELAPPPSAPAIPPRTPATGAVAPLATPDPGAAKAPPLEMQRIVIPPKPAATNAARAVPSTPPAKTDTAVAPKLPLATNVPKPAAATAAPPAVAVETVKLQPEPTIKAAQDTSHPTAPAPAPPAGQVSAPPPLVASSTVSTNTAEPKAAKRSLLQRLNPLNLFGSNTGKSNAFAPIPTGVTEVAIAPAARETNAARTFPRYHYRAPAKPAAGNRDEAQRAFDQAIQAQQLPQVIQAYRQAVQLDPSFFPAYYNLGLAASQLGNQQMALDAYETALAIDPESANARYNFALLLEQGGYMVDSANELERLLSRSPSESRAQLALGNIYAQQLRQPAKARQCYEKVLETDPRNPQAPAIREWLLANAR
jgi:tetratricopeptide (TPR) repeat protein